MEKKYNYGLTILKIWMSFEVVLLHFWSRMRGEPTGILSLFSQMCTVAVPVFMILSFYLTGKQWDANNKVKTFLNRMKRLVIPYIFWPAILFLGYRIVDAVFNSGISYALYDLKFNYITGTVAPVGQLWFQLELMIFTAIFFGLFLIVKNERVLVVGILAVVSILFQYNGTTVNVGLFGNSISTGYFFLFGRFFEVFPYACLGYILYKTQVLEKLREKWITTVILSVIALYIILHYDMFIYPESFGYAGLYLLNITVLLMVIFYVIPFEKLGSVFIKIVSFVGRYTMGIYLIHYFIGDVVNQVICPYMEWRTNTFRTTVLIYVISWMLSFLISLIPGKISKMLVE